MTSNYFNHILFSWPFVVVLWLINITRYSTNCITWKLTTKKVSLIDMPWYRICESKIRFDSVLTLERTYWCEKPNCRSYFGKMLSSTEILLYAFNSGFTQLAFLKILGLTKPFNRPKNRYRDYFHRKTINWVLCPSQYDVVKKFAVGMICHLSIDWWHWGPSVILSGLPK